MIDLGPPPKFLLDPPAIIRLAELWRPSGVERATFPFPVIGAGVSTADGYPIVKAIAASQYSGGTTTKTHDLPAGIQAGNLLVMAFRCHNSINTVTTPTGWTLLASRVSAGAGHIFYKAASGSEGSTVSITSTTSGASVAIVFMISSYLGNPEGSFVASSTSDPPSLTPSWGSAKTLFIAGCSVSGSASATLVTGVPTNYGTLDQITSSLSTTADVRIATARRKLHATSDDPSAFTYASATGGMAFIFGVRPA